MITRELHQQKITPTRISKQTQSELWESEVRNPKKIYDWFSEAISRAEDEVFRPNHEVDGATQNYFNSWSDLKRKNEDLFKLKVHELIEDTAREMASIEISARFDTDPIKPSIKNQPEIEIIVFGGPGTYFTYTKPNKRDPFYMNGWDRQRNDAGALLAIYLAALKTDNMQLYTPFSGLESLIILNSSQLKLQSDIKTAITESDVKLTYIGNPTEADAVRQALKSPLCLIPDDPRVVTVHDREIINTYSQAVYIKNKMQNEQNSPLRHYIIISHAPHVVRIARFLKEALGEVSSDKISFYVLKTPDIGGYDFPRKEIKGIVYNTLIGKAGEASIPYSVITSLP